MSTPGNSIGETTTGITGFTGTGFVGTPVTQYNVLTGAATSSALNNVAPNSTVGTPFCSAGAASQPTFNTTPTVTSITISNSPVASTDGTNKSYVDSAIAAVNPATSVLEASTAALTATYSNGVSGIGATLTNAGTQAAFTLDGQSTIIGDRVLIKDQASTLQNGVYTVTVVGTGITNWVLTRALDYDQPSNINSTGVINVLNGTVNALTGWLINSKITTVGTDAITYSKYNNAPITTTQFAVLVGAASNGVASVGPGSSGQILQSGGGASNPAYTTATYPATTTVNQLLYSSATNAVSGLATANNGVLITSASGVPSLLANGTTGQVLTATTGSPPSWVNPAIPVPTGTINLIDDFVSIFNSGSNTISQFSWFKSGAWVVNTTDITSSNPGIISMPASAGAASLQFANTGAVYSPFILGGGVLTLTWIIRIDTLSNGTNRYTLRVGFGNTNNADQVDGVYFEYSDNTNSGNWIIKTASASTRTTTNTAVAVATGFVNLTLVVNAAASSVTFSINGVAQTPITTNIPTVALSPVISIVTGAGTVAAASVNVDLFSLNQILTTPR